MSSIRCFTVVFDNEMRSKLFDTLSACIKAIALAAGRSRINSSNVVCGFPLFAIKKAHHTKQTQHSYYYTSLLFFLLYIVLKAVLAVFFENIQQVC